MKINGEEVELVTDFASLRAGMTVWVRPCNRCNGQHRMMLVGFGSHLPGVWTGLPLASCCSPKEFAGNAIRFSIVERGKVYRVVDPLLDAKPVTRAKELAR
jgi:hypothetical protein